MAIGADGLGAGDSIVVVHHWRNGTPTLASPRSRLLPVAGAVSITRPLTVSVVIPTYNRAEWLGRAIDSALDQIHSSDEVIVVDDGSTDGTVDLLDTYLDRITIVAGQRSGAGAARNRGIRAATRDLVAFLDSDDEWFPGKLEAQRRLLESRPDVIATFGDMACTFLDGSIARRHLWTWHRDPRAWEEILPHQWLFSELAPLPAETDDFLVHIGNMFADMAHRLYVLTSSFVARREEAGDALQFEEGVPIYEDWACFARVARLGNVAFMDTELAWQHGHAPDRVSDADQLQRATIHLKLLDEIWGQDAQYLDAREAEFRSLVESVRRNKASTEILRGLTRDARSTLAKMQSPPLSFRLLSRFPRPVVRSLLAIRRSLRARSP